MALTKDQLIELWKSSVDEDFARQLLEKTDSGIEVVEASAEIMATVSDSIEQTSQSLFLRPWSGQTYPPATGAAFAHVVIELSRVAPANDPIVFIPGFFIVEQELHEHGPEVGIMVGTGRRYVPLAPIAFLPGTSLVSAEFVAEREGAAFNLPQADTITRIDDAGSFAGSAASLVPGVTNHRLILAPEGETAPPSAIGQYVRIAAGSNEGQLRRIVDYVAPDPNAPHNGILILDASELLSVSSVSGTFTPGERVEQTSTGAAAALIAQEGGYLLADRLVPAAFTAGGTIVGVVSGATATIDDILGTPDMLAETATVGWQVESWEDLGFSVTNPDRPTGGQTPTLDHIGEERSIGRSPGEQDEPYRARVYSRPDVVSPNALVRAMNRVLAPYGLTGCIREPSDLDTFQGLFYDAPANGPVDRRYAYDMNFDLRPADRWKLSLDLAEFRGFFVATVPPMSLGEFGMFFDEGFINFFDAAPYPNFFDGFAVTANAIRIAVWNALNEAREAGVGFVLVEDRFGC